MTTTPAPAATPPRGTAFDPAVRVAQLGYVGFGSPDVPRLIEYYTTVLGFAVVEDSPRQAFIATGRDHHCVVIDKAPEAAGRTVVGYEFHGNIDDAQRRLADRGLTGERRSDIGPGTPDVLVLTEPGTGVALHLYEERSASGVAPTFDQRPNKLGHVAAFVPSITEMHAFYQEALGFRSSDTIGDFFVFLRCNVDHHAANFMANPTKRGMHHIAYEARDLVHLQTMIDNLARHDYRLTQGPGRHGAGHKISTATTTPTAIRSSCSPSSTSCTTRRRALRAPPVARGEPSVPEDVGGGHAGDEPVGSAPARRYGWRSLTPAHGPDPRKPQGGKMSTVLESDLDETLENLGDRMMASFEVNDKDAYLQLFAPGATVWLSYMEGSMPAEQNAALLGELYASFVESMRYADIRRHRTADGYLQQHTLTLVSKSGASFSASACSLVHIDGEGRIVRLEEYIDSKIIKFGAEQTAASATAPPPSADWSVAGVEPS